MTHYDHLEIERKWQEYWDRHGTFRAGDPGDPDFDASKPKMYVLDMFPYPSGEGLHVGQPIGYIGTDIYSRYQRMRGHNVLHPMGFDAFGLPAEQYAVETGIHPRITTERNVANYEGQLRSIGLSYDWDRMLSTTDAGYYRWTQWIFLRLFGSWFDPDRQQARPIDELEEELEAGRRSTEGTPWADLDPSARRRYLDGRRLAYIDEVMVNWCPALGTVLANEEVTRDGKSERGDHPVFRRPLRQWMLRITAYADRLTDDLDLVEWPESVKAMQRNWIGRSEGATIRFAVAGGESAIEVFTTRPDTIFGATYVVVAPDHPLVPSLVAEEWPAATRPLWTGSSATPGEAVTDYVADALSRTEIDRQMEAREKTGVFTGSFCINPVTDDPIPVFVADYVLLGYGTGAIMAVPGQDERDWEFAEIFDLPIVRTVDPPAGWEGKAYLGEGPAINSGFLDGLNVAAAKERIIEWLDDGKLGRATITFKLHDWLFSRQRYWGEPIPILHGPDGELRAVADADLPVLLPALDDFKPDTDRDERSDPVPALGRADEEWRVVVIDGVPYRRELNTMPQWAGSCWYYLRFADPGNTERLVGEAAERYWMGEHGVDLYVGGVEHAVLHLLYARFWHKVLYDLGLVSTPEPFGRLFNQGYILADAFQDDRGFYVPAEKVEFRDGAYLYEDEVVHLRTGKMGKSKKNSVTPDEFVAEHGADTLRLYEMFMGPLDASKPWTTRDIVGVIRFLQRLWRNHVDPDTGEMLVTEEQPNEEISRLLHKTIRQVTEDMGHLSFNTALARMFELNNALVPLDRIPRAVSEAFVRILSPLAPHICEELWERLGHEPSISTASWPDFDDALAADETVTMVVQVNGKVRDRIEVPVDITEGSARELALGSEKVQSLLAGAEPRRVIVRPPSLVNVVQ